MEKEKFNGVVKALYTLRNANSRSVDSRLIEGIPDLTENQKKFLVNEFAKKKFQPDITYYSYYDNSENDYF